MAILNASTSVNLTNFLEAEDELIPQGPSQFFLGGFDSFYGAEWGATLTGTGFLYDVEGDVIAGTVESIAVSGAQNYTLTGVSFNLAGYSPYDDGYTVPIDNVPLLGADADIAFLLAGGHRAKGGPSGSSSRRRRRAPPLQPRARSRVPGGCRRRGRGCR